MAKLTPKQERFVDEYLVDLNATAAAKRAGYSEKSASRIAIVTVTGAGLLCVKATSEVPKNKLPAIAGIKYSQLGIEIKLHDKVRALELLGKHLGVFATGGSAAAAEENNIFEVIEQSTREEIDTNEIPEIEPPAEPGDDVVE